MSEANPSSARKIPVPTDEVHHGARQVSPLTYSSVTPDEMRGLTRFVREYEEAGRKERSSMIRKLARELATQARNKSERRKQETSPRKTRPHVH